MARVLGVIGARLNSSRLPAKHLLSLADKPMIARIFERLERIPEIDRLVLATTDDAYNRPLFDWAVANGKAVFAYQGDVNDLVGRVDTLVQIESPDIVIYFCGDSPLIEPQTVSRHIRALQNETGDVVELAPAASGAKYIHEGFLVYRRWVWDRLTSEAQLPEEREHVGASLRRFRQQLSVVFVSEEPVFSSVEHRISVDTPSDYQFMSEVYRRWYANHPADSIVALSWVIDQVQQDQSLAGINAHVRQKAVGDVSMSALIVCHAGGGIGLGHLSRALAIARALQDTAFAGVRMLVQGDEVTRKDLDLIPHRYVSSKKPLPAAIRQEVLTKRPDVVLFDIHSRWVTQDLVPLFAELKTASIRLVAIDSLLDYCDEFDLTLVPSFFVDPKKMANCHRSLLSGWDYYLLSRPEQMQPWSPGNKVLVLTGGSDTTNLGRTLPQMLDDALPIGAEVHWVQGPFAEPPRLPTTQRIRWVLHKAPQGLGALMAQTNYALTVYGVSFFELLQHGIPTVVFSPYGGRDHLELERLSRENIAIVAADGRSAVTALGNLMGTPETAGGLSRQAASKIDGQGALRLAQRVRQLVGAK